MTDFFDAEQFKKFSSDEELFTFIIERIVKPQLRSAMDGDEDALEHMEGKVLVFGGVDGVNPDEITAIQHKVQEGADLDYILRELTDLRIVSIRKTTVGNLHVQYIELGPASDGISALSPEELEAMFLDSPDS